MYPSLVGSVHKCWIGYQSLFTSFHALERYRGQTDAELEKAIATILVMLFEAPRFDQVYQTSLLLLQGGRDQQVGATLKNMINNWYDDKQLGIFQCKEKKPVFPWLPWQTMRWRRWHTTSESCAGLHGTFGYRTLKLKLLVALVEIESERRHKQGTSPLCETCREMGMLR
jgi:hypothetical protein